MNRKLWPTMLSLRGLHLKMPVYPSSTTWSAGRSMVRIGLMWIKKRQLRAYPQFLEMGVTPRGVLLRNPKGGDVLENWPYKEVVSWGFTERKFILVVGDIVQQKRVVFGTKRGKQIRNLIHAHMQYIVKARLDMAKDIHRIAQENLKMSLGYQAHEVAPQNRDF
mmetsp:Transcript_20887/g.33060  ORF Transcript_20887/g.33060 Transcript_20887/m.33060 type:complete len:164 (+) Transcript_20887:636-1127(+)